MQKAFHDLVHYDATGRSVGFMAQRIKRLQP